MWLICMALILNPLLWKESVSVFLTLLHIVMVWKHFVETLAMPLSLPQPWRKFGQELDCSLVIKLVLLLLFNMLFMVCTQAVTPSMHILLNSFASWDSFLPIMTMMCGCAYMRRQMAMTTFAPMWMTSRLLCTIHCIGWILSRVLSWWSLMAHLPSTLVMITIGLLQRMLGSWVVPPISRSVSSVWRTILLPMGNYSFRKFQSLLTVIQNLMTPPCWMSMAPNSIRCLLEWPSGCAQLNA